MNRQAMVSKTNAYLLASIISGILYLILSFLVTKGSLRSIDYSSMVIFQGHIGRIVDLPFSVLSLIGSAEIISIILFFLFLYFLINQKRLFLGIFLYFLIFILELFGKLYIYQPVPPGIFHRYALFFSFPSGSLVDTQFSYPSGHMARSVFLVLILFFLLYRKINSHTRRVVFTVLLVVFIALLVVSRVYLGEHWLSDVMGGIFLGSSIGFLALRLR